MSESANAAVLPTGFNIVNVERVKIVTHEQSPRTIIYQTMTKFSADPHVEKGEEKVQRVKNTLMGRLKTDDLIGGYDIECEDERFIMDVIALVNGGTVTGDTYSGPKPGAPTVRTAFDLYLYSSNRDTDGACLNYLEFTFPGCKGTPVKFGAEDMNFSKQNYKIESRPAADEDCVSVTVVESLPQPSA